MENILNGGVAELEAAKAAVLDRDAKEEAAHQAAMAKKSKEKDLEAQKKYVEDKVKSTIKEKRNSLIKVYEDQISSIGKEKSAAIKARRNARNAAVDTKIKSETSDLANETARIKTELKSVFKRVKAPAFCKTRYYYAMFYPRGAFDFLLFALTTIIAVAVIPNVVCALIKPGSLLVKILIYAAIVLFFLIVYLLIFITTKGGKKGKVILQARALSDKIRANKKQLRRMSREIKSNPDESEYGLEIYDENINQLNSSIAKKEQAMSAALEDFDKTTAPSIESDIRGESQSEIDALTQAAADLAAEADKKKEEAQAAKNLVATDYEALLGVKNTTIEKLDGMIALINEGKAQTVLQAMSQINGEITQ